MRKDLVEALTLATNAPGTDLAQAALVIARIEYPRLDAEPYLAQLDEMGAAPAVPSPVTLRSGRRARRTARFRQSIGTSSRTCASRAISHRYDDPRDSCLNEVLNRRTGIPITISVVYMEVARRAGLQIDGVNFPGHFLVRCPEFTRNGDRPDHRSVSWRRRCSPSRNAASSCNSTSGPGLAFNRSLLAPATRLQIIVRMLLNLKRLYVRMRSFPQARVVTELLVAMTPSALSELRDRGCSRITSTTLPARFRDLQTYLKLASMSELDKEERQEHEQIWEHVKTLRRRVAALN